VTAGRRLLQRWGPLVIADVVVAGFESKFWWKLGIPGLQPRNFAPVGLPVGAIRCGKREQHRLVDAVANAGEHPAHTAHQAI